MARIIYSCAYTNENNDSYPYGTLNGEHHKIEAIIDVGQDGLERNLEMSAPNEHWGIVSVTWDDELERVVESEKHS